MKTIKSILAAVLLYFGILNAGTAQINQENWILPETNTVNYSFEKYKGYKSIALTRKMFGKSRAEIAYLKDIDYQDAIVEADICLPSEKGYIGLAFRIQNKYKYECVYFRPHCSGEIHATQYMPSNESVFNWWDYDSEKYNFAAKIPADKWFHVKLVYKNKEVRIYVDYRDEPVIMYKNLGHGVSSGSIGVWLGNCSKGYFSNVKCTPLK